MVKISVREHVRQLLQGSSTSSS